MRKDTNVRSGSLKFSDDVSGVLKMITKIAEADSKVEIVAGVDQFQDLRISSSSHSEMVLLFSSLP